MRPRAGVRPDPGGASLQVDTGVFTHATLLLRFCSYPPPCPLCPLSVHSLLVLLSRLFFRFCVLFRFCMCVLFPPFPFHTLSCLDLRRCDAPVLFVLMSCCHRFFTALVQYHSINKFLFFVFITTTSHHEFFRFKAIIILQLLYRHKTSPF